MRAVTKRTVNVGCYRDATKQRNNSTNDSSVPGTCIIIIVPPWATKGKIVLVEMLVQKLEQGGRDQVRPLLRVQVLSFWEGTQCLLGNPGGCRWLHRQWSCLSWPMPLWGGEFPSVVVEFFRGSLNSLDNSAWASPNCLSVR